MLYVIYFSFQPPMPVAVTPVPEGSVCLSVGAGTGVCAVDSPAMGTQVGQHLVHYFKAKIAVIIGQILGKAISCWNSKDPHGFPMKNQNISPQVDCHLYIDSPRRIIILLFVPFSFGRLALVVIFC